MNEKQEIPNPDMQEFDEFAHYPPYLQKYFKLKESLKGPELIRDEDGLTPKRFTKKYFEDTCPFCETTAEHEGKKYKYSKVTKRKFLTNSLMMIAAAFMTGFGILNMFVGFAVILILGYATSSHAERKMYYSLLCRNCGAHFPMDKEEQDKIRQEEKEKKEKQEQEEQEQEKEEENE